MTPAEGGGDNLWKALLHYIDWESRIEDPSFFLHQEGRWDPDQELQEFIRRLKKNPDLQCRFPARAYYVREILGIYFPQRQCDELQKFLNAFRGDSISIVFADAHINSPASMFGHTFLRIYEEERSLYSFIANYSAKVERDPGITYAIKGLTGGYRGFYSVAPFYEKIREYSGIEGRDLWEYELIADPKRLHLLKLHLFELRGVYSNYYFFTKNCSSEVFYLLRILYPDSNLLMETTWTIPVDTIRLLRRRGFVRRVRFTPSLLKELETFSEYLSKEEISEIKKWARGKGSLSLRGKALYYETAGSYVRFLYYRGSLDLESYRKLYLESLRMRARARSERKIKVKKTTPPHLSHGSQRLSIGAGAKKVGGGSSGIYTLSYRPVYHDLLDRPDGFRKGSEIRFSQVDLEYLVPEGSLLLSKWTLIRIVSLEPVKTFYRPISWFVNFGFERGPLKRGGEGGFLSLRSGGGYTVSLGGAGFSILAEARARTYSTESFSGGGGLKGVLLYQGKVFSLLASLFYGGFAAGKDKGTYLSAKTGISLHPFRNYSLRIEAESSGFARQDWQRIIGSFHLYF